MSFGIDKIAFVVFLVLLYPLYYAKVNTYLIAILSDTSNCKEELPGAWLRDDELEGTEGAEVEVTEEAVIEKTDEAKAGIMQRRVSFLSPSGIHRVLAHSLLVCQNENHGMKSRSVEVTDKEMVDVKQHKVRYLFIQGIHYILT